MENIELRKIIDSLMQEPITIEENNEISYDIGYTSDGRILIGIAFPRRLLKEQLERMIQELEKMELLDNIKEYSDKIILELKNGKDLRCYRFINEEKYSCRY